MISKRSDLFTGKRKGSEILYRSKTGILTAGALMTGAQVLLIRRALALAGGDEIVFALTLTLWLLFTAAGGAFGSRLIPHLKNPAKAFSRGLFLLSVSVPLSLIILQYVTIRTAWLPGTVPGGGALFFALMMALFPVGLLGGSLFPIGCRVTEAVSSSAVSVTFLLESAGSFLAGTVTALIFAPHLGGLTMAVYFALIGMGVSLSISFKKIPIRVTLPAALLLATALHPFMQSTEKALFARLRPGLQLLDLLETPYGLIEVTDLAGQISIHENGLLLANSDDRYLAEERAHITLAQHPDPKTVLWIGGSLGSSVEEALKHPSIKRLDLVELNPLLFSLQTVLAGADSTPPYADPRVKTHRADGRRFLCDTPPQTYDIIALFLPGPRTARLAKFYTVEFFRTVRRALKPGGVLVFPLESSDSYIGKDIAFLLATMNATLKKVFARVAVLPGNKAYFVAGDTLSKPAVTADEIIARWRSSGVTPLYWDPYRMRDRFEASRRQMVQQALATGSVVGINRDAAPVCFYLQQVVWSSQVEAGFPLVLKTAHRIFAPLAAAFLLLMTAMSFLFKKHPQQKRRKPTGILAVSVVGLTGISLEILALVVYQMYFGSGYREVGVLLGCYMAGLALGAALFSRIIRPEGLFRFVQGLWCLAPFGLIFLISPAAGWISFGLLGRLLLWGYMLTVGFLGGLHFPLAVHFSGSADAKQAGVFYASDLIGASSGALLIGLLALPLIGIVQTAAGLIWLNLLMAWLIPGKLFPFKSTSLKAA